MTSAPLIYFADPMCSWCYGFAPVIERVRAEYGAAFGVSLVMGGLRPGPSAPMQVAGLASVREHWEHVAAASGQPFDLRFFERPSFVYDTEPASRAVVCARRMAPARDFEMLGALQRAFYADGRDVTSSDVLCDVAHELGFDRADFAAQLASDALRRLTARDFSIAQAVGMTGFPALVAGGADGTLTALVIGYQDFEVVETLLARWWAGQPQAALLQ